MKSVSARLANQLVSRVLGKAEAGGDPDHAARQTGGRARTCRLGLDTAERRAAVEHDTRLMENW